MQGTTFAKKTSGGQRPRVDRFVAPRDSFEELRLRCNWNVREERTLDIWSSKYLRKKKYESHLSKAFGLDAILNLKQRFKSKKEYLVQPWPCVPRKKQFLSSADSILDLPSYSNTPFPDLLDWSNDNILVAAIGYNYHKWSWHTQSLVNSGVTQFEILCCKFDPRGERLLLGTRTSFLEVHDSISNKMLKNTICRCGFPHGRLIEPQCNITALDWSPTGNSFVTGCSNGTISSYTREVLGISSIFLHNIVLMVRVSPNARQLAVSLIDHSFILIYTWPELQPLSKMQCLAWPSKLRLVFAWHPWRTAFLGIGATRDGGDESLLATWDVNAQTTSYTTLSTNHHVIDTLLFSHRTGEMVLSLWKPGITSSYSRGTSHLIVLSDPETVVDQWGEGHVGLDRVRTMVFSPDGTKLATATADEDLILWNFLPEDTKGKKTSSRRLSAMPVFLDEATYGFSVR